EWMIAQPGDSVYPLMAKKAGREMEPSPQTRSRTAVGIEDGAVVAGAGRRLGAGAPGTFPGAGRRLGDGPGARATVWTEDRAVLGPKSGEESPELGEAAGGGFRAFY